MSVKDDVASIRKEISAEESYMENFFKVEKLLKKYKKVLIAGVATAVIGTVGYYVSDYLAEQNKLQANEAFNILQENPKDIEAQAVLKVKNPQLYEIFQYTQDKTQANQETFFKELVLYRQAIKENDIEKITAVTQQQNFLLKDFALFNKAMLEVENKKYADAKATLQLIEQNSEVRPIAQMLEHFLLTK